MLALTGAILIIFWMIAMFAHITGGMIDLSLILGLVLTVMHFLEGKKKAHR